MWSAISRVGPHGALTTGWPCSTPADQRQGRAQILASARGVAVEGGLKQWLRTLRTILDLDEALAMTTPPLETAFAPLK